MIWRTVVSVQAASAGAADGSGYSRRSQRVGWFTPLVLAPICSLAIARPTLA